MTIQVQTKGDAMSNQVQTPQAEDVFSVGTRISWGAIVGGAFVALAIHFMLTVLGAACGLTMGDRVSPSTLKMATVVWTILTLCAAVFVGGLITSLFTVGENKIEATFFGVIMWAFLLAMLFYLGRGGFHTGFHAMVPMLHSSAAGDEWEASAREAGISVEQIQDIRRKLAASRENLSTKADEAKVEQDMAAATRLTWYAFCATWLSMIAAAAGSYVGAGPTFRLVTVAPQTRII